MKKPLKCLIRTSIVFMSSILFIQNSSLISFGIGSTKEDWYEVVDLLKQIFVNNPSERISLKDIMSHEWTKQSIDFLTENGNLPKRTDDITFESVKTIEEIVSIINTFAKEKQAKVSTRSQKELKFQFEIHEPFKIIFAIKISKINEINQINIKKLRIDSPPNFYRLIKELSIRTSEDVC